MRNDYRRGLSQFKQCIKLSGPQSGVLINIGATHSLSGNFNRANWFLNAHLAKQPKEKMALLWLVQNHLNRGDMQTADHHLNQLLKTTSDKALLAWLTRLSRRPLHNDQLIVPALAGVNREKLVRRVYSGAW
jgi:Tfp pilus assembly protein PilF